MAAPGFSLRIVSLDYYLAEPIPGVDVCFSATEGSAIDQVPVVRIFGATPSGQKACLHLHKVRGMRVLCMLCLPRWRAGACNGDDMHVDVMAHHTPCTQAFPYLYVPYDDDLPQEPAAGECAGGGGGGRGTIRLAQLCMGRPWRGAAALPPCQRIALPDTPARPHLHTHAQLPATCGAWQPP